MAMIRAEAALHQEVAWQIKATKPACIIVPIPNGTWLPARTDKERAIVARLIARMKAEGQILAVRKLAIDLGIDGTPAFVIGDTIVPGDDTDAVNSAINQARAHSG